MNFIYRKRRLDVFSAISSKNHGEEVDSEAEDLANLDVLQRKSSLLTIDTTANNQDSERLTKQMVSHLGPEMDEQKFEDVDVDINPIQSPAALVPRGNKKTNKAKRKYAMKGAAQ